MNTIPQEAKDYANKIAAPLLAKGYNKEALHAYTSATGEIILYRVRLKNHSNGEKWIRPFHRNGSGYKTGEPEFTNGKPLYRLHDLASNQDTPVYLVEGEAKADALAELGLITTTSGSASSAGTADWAPLQGRTVIIWRDFDAAGLRYACECAARLQALGCTVRWVNVKALGLAEKGDVVDWLKLHPDATRADLGALPLVAATVTQSDWPEPQPLVAKVTPEPYPLDALPDTIRAAVEEVLGFTKAPVPLAASSALGALSLAIQAHVDVKRADRLQGPSSLFLLSIADPSERKTTCDGFFTTAIREYQEQQAEAAKPLIKDNKAKVEAWDAKRSGIKDKIRQLAKETKSTAEQESALRDLEHEKPEAPRVPKLIRGDETPENLAWVLAKEWPSGGVVSSEAGIVFGAHGMGKDSIMRNLALLNILWEGGTLPIGRRTSESFEVRGVRLTVALQVQEATLRSFFEKSGGLARGTGFLSRFLVAWPESTQGYRPFTEPPPHWPALAAFNRRLAEILQQPAPMDEDGTLSPALLPLSPDAKAAWVAYHDAIEAELRSGGELYDVRDVAGKSADNAARLAAKFHVFGGVAGAIDADSFDGASRIAAWHLNESRRFFGELALPEELANAARLNNWLLDYCRRERSLIVPIAKLQQGGPPGLRKREVIEGAMRELEELHRARLQRDGRKKEIHVNPALIEGGAQ